MKKYLIVLFGFLAFACKKETIPQPEAISLNEKWNTGVGVNGIPYATQNGVVGKFYDGIRYFDGETGNIKWYIKTPYNLSITSDNSFIHNNIFYTLPTEGARFKAIDIDNGIELFEYWQSNLLIDRFIRFTTDYKIRFSGSYLNELAVFELDAEGNNLDTIFKVTIPGVSDVTGLDCVEDNYNYYVLFFASTIGINNQSVNFCAINKQTFNITNHIQGLALQYDERLKYHFLDITSANSSFKLAQVGTDLFRLAPQVNNSYKISLYTADVVTHGNSTFRLGYDESDLIKFEGTNYNESTNIPSAWDNVYCTIDANSTHVFYPSKAATVSVYDLAMKSQKSFQLDFISSSGIHVSADETNKIMYVMSSNKLFSVPYETN